MKINMILREYLKYIFNDKNIPFNDIIYKIYEKIFMFYQPYEKLLHCDNIICIETFIIWKNMGELVHCKMIYVILYFL